MKKYVWKLFLLFVAFVSAFSCLRFAPFYASAESSPLPKQGDYACVISDTAYFYATTDEKSGVFLLPESYYIRLLEYRTDYCKIEYLQDDGYTKKVIGYTKTQDLAFVDYVPTRPYLYYLFDLKYTLGEGGNATSDSLTEITVTCAYYGDFTVGTENWCYILRDGEFGYIPKPADLSFERNTEYEDRLSIKTESSLSTPSPTEKSSSPIQIGILVALCLLIPVLGALILKPPRRPPYEREEDYS